MAQIHVNAMSLAKMLKAIELRPRTAEAVSEETGLAVRTIRNHFKYLIKEQLMHVTGWLPDAVGRDRVALYLLGFGVNVPRARMTATERSMARYHRNAEGKVSSYHRSARVKIEAQLP